MTGGSSPARHALEEYLAAPSPDAPVAVLALDLDNFKGINDSAGHAAGDHVLSVVANRIAAAIRSEDQAARVGGDEYVVVCASPGSNERAQALADRLVTTLHEPISFRGALHAVGASAGVAMGIASEAANLLDQADKACYEAKRSRGNRAVGISDTLTVRR